MRIAIVSMAAAAAIVSAVPAVAKPGNGHGGHQAAKHQKHQSQDRGLRDVRSGTRYGQQRYSGACPPGLAKKNNGCLAPGQAKKLARGSRLPDYLSRYNVPAQYQDRYRDNRDYSYRYEDQNIYRVNRGTGVIDQIISVLGR
jgi:hypothetical protein